MEKVFIPNNKGLKLAAVIHRSEGDSDKLAILCPGYLDAKDYDHLVILADDLAKQGHTAVRFDPTGTWESEGSIDEYMTTQYLADIKSVLEYMLQEKPYKQILLGGHSRGGKVSLIYAGNDLRITTVLSIMAQAKPIADSRAKEAQETGFNRSTRDIPSSSERKEFKVPYSHILDNNKYDVISEVKKIKSRLILIAGELDTICTPEEIKKIYDNANEPKKYILIPGIGHDYRLNKSEIRLVNDTILKNL